MPIWKNVEAEDLFRRALGEFAPQWRIEKFGRLGSDPSYWPYDTSVDQFGATVTRLDERGLEEDARVLGKQPPALPPVNRRFSYQPSIPGEALERYQAGDHGPIRSYLQDVGLMGHRKIGF